MLAPFSLTQAIDTNGRPVRTAALMVYQAGTTTPAVLYRQADYVAGTEHPNPIPVNGYGLLPAMYGNGAFKFRLLSAPVGGSILWEADGITLTDPVAVDPDAGQNNGLVPTGAIVSFYATGSRSGYVRANGRSIGNAASGGTERASGDTLALYLSLWSEDTALVVAGGRGQTAQADFDANKALSLPDMRGRALYPMDGMGAGAVGTYPGVTFGVGGSSTRLGSVAGAMTLLIGEANLPLHTHTATATIDPGGAFNIDGNTSGASATGHTHAVAAQGINITVGGPTAIFYLDPNQNFTTAFPTSSSGAAHSHGFNVNQPAHAHTASVSIGGTGNGNALSSVPPLMLVTTYIKL